MYAITTSFPYQEHDIFVLHPGIVPALWLTGAALPWADAEAAAARAQGGALLRRSSPQISRYWQQIINRLEDGRAAPCRPDDWWTDRRGPISRHPSSTVIGRHQATLDVIKRHRTSSVSAPGGLGNCRLPTGGETHSTSERSARAGELGGLSMNA